MNIKIDINPLTRLEGHGQIDVEWGPDGKIQGVHFRVPEFRGFETFCQGRAAEEMSTLTEKICGVCPMAHLMVSAKALDDVFCTKIPVAAEIIRKLVYHAFIYEDHLLHFYFLGGPDFLISSDSGIANRNILGVIQSLGDDVGRQVLNVRKQVRDLVSKIAGSALYPVLALPGGVSRSLDSDVRDQARKVSSLAVEFACQSLRIFKSHVLAGTRFHRLLNDPAFYLPTGYMGMVNASGQIDFYDGLIRIIDAAGRPIHQFAANQVMAVLAERMNALTRIKTIHCREGDLSVGASGSMADVCRVGPLARLNVTDGLPTRLAQAEYEEWVHAFGGKPVHHTLAYHWARLIEALYAAETMVELADNSALTSAIVHTIPQKIKPDGAGACEAPRGALFHLYRVDEHAIIQHVNLIVATQINAAAIGKSIEKAAMAFLSNGDVTDSAINHIEMAYRAYDPCLACATH